MSLRRNLLAGIANSTWSALAGLVLVPLYIKYLGIGAYGLIGFFATTQTLLSLLDLGITPAINREVARCAASGSIKDVGVVLHTLGVVYWCAALLIAGMFVALSPAISSHWLKSESLSAQDTVQAVMLMGLVVAARWPIGLYQGAIIGAQRLPLLSGINMTMTALSGLGAVAVLRFISPTIQAFFIWQCCAGIANAAVLRGGAWRIIGRAANLRFDVDSLRNIWRFSAGMSGVAISTVILIQSDKVLLSKMLNLEEFGRYMLAVLLSNGLLVLLTPVFNVIYPRLTALVVAGNDARVLNFYRTGTAFLASALFPIAAGAIICSNDLLFLWTGNGDLARNAAPILSFLLLGTAVNGVMIFPYALQLASGMSRLPLIISYTMLLIHVPLTYCLVRLYGPIGGALGWAAFNCIYLVFGTWMTHRRLLKGVGIAWLARDVGVPLAATLFVMPLGWKLFYVPGAYWMNVFSMGASTVFTGCSVLMSLQPGSVLTAWRRVSNMRI